MYVLSRFTDKNTIGIYLISKVIKFRSNYHSSQKLDFKQTHMTMKKALCVSTFTFFLIVYSNAQYCGDLSAKNISEQCRSQLTRVCNESNSNLLWKLFDASSKYPLVGLSYSSGKDMGNYDECMSIDYTDSHGNIRGKFCPYSIVFITPIKYEVDDPYIDHPEDVEKTAYTSTTHSACVPDACKPSEVGDILIPSDLPVVYLDETAALCSTKNDERALQWYDALFIAFLVLILCLIIYSTGYDYFLERIEQKPRHPLLLAFSVKTNGRRLFHVSDKVNKEQITCLHGLRCISMLWIIAGHNYGTSQQVPISNYAEMLDWKRSYLSQLILSGPIAVDTFFFLSGFMMAYGYIKKNKNRPVVRQIVDVPMMVVHRYFRLTPAVIVLFLATITIFKTLGSGPLWPTVADLFRRQCLDHWWAFLIYVQNYVNPDDQCLNHTWYLSADMQMFLLSFLALIPLTVMLRRNQNIVGIVFIAILAVVTIAITLVVRFVDETYNSDYDTHSRLSDYLIGVILGIIFRQYQNKPFPFTKLQNLLIWIFVIAVCIGFNALYHDVLLDVYRTKATLFYALYRPVWSACLAWLVYSCYHGYGGIINSFLSLSVFQIGSRLCYCMYLIHAMVIVYWVGHTRQGYLWDDYDMFYLWSGHTAITLVISIIWTLAFESPLMIVEKFIFGGGGKPSGAQPKEGGNNVQEKNGVV